MQALTLALLAELPEGELDLDDQIRVLMVEGAPSIVTTKAQYGLTADGCAVRVRRTGPRMAEVAVFQGGVMLGVAARGRG